MDLMMQHGFYYDAERTGKALEAIRNIPKVAKWVIKNLRVFTKHAY